ncbi:hypothetical protein FKG94_15185 [Exilibacterium tricleocarpae]|uniref:Uncharacterized protein n=1 Tax=Exilibacterium tricleocarpae TaxID=2591008 RepID=A0A545TFK7_9GAMM|nr:hypothetical protein [Exilibacterium tricleocarpae]TQV75956.1 hypothetical protein FKG94_15185 [Exilibacterium tricleocarpae]
MLENIYKHLEGLYNRRGSFDASAFDDPVAMETDWWLIEPRNGGLRLHKLVNSGLDRVEIRTTMAGKAFCLIFVLIGVFLIGYFFYGLFDGLISALSALPALSVGLIFSGAGIFFFRLMSKTLFFDKNKGFFWKGDVELDMGGNNSSLEYFHKIKNIHALQLVSEGHRVSTRNKKFVRITYELNVVLKDARRLNIARVGGGGKIKKGQEINSVSTRQGNKLKDDAVALSRFLNKPVWDTVA